MHWRLVKIKLWTVWFILFCTFCRDLLKFTGYFLFTLFWQDCRLGLDSLDYVNIGYILQPFINWLTIKYTKHLLLERATSSWLSNKLALPDSRQLILKATVYSVLFESTCFLSFIRWRCTLGYGIKKRSNLKYESSLLGFRTR